MKNIWNQVPQCLLFVAIGVLLGIALHPSIQGDSLRAIASQSGVDSSVQVQSFQHIKGSAQANAGTNTAEFAELNAALQRHGMSVTAKDIEATALLTRHESEGRYVRKYERPISRKLLQLTIAELVEDLKTNAVPIHEKRLQALGVTPAEIERIAHHLGQLHKAALEAEAAIEENKIARNNYDVKIRGILGHDNYNIYRSWAGGLRADRQVENLAKNIHSISQLDAAMRSRLASMIRNADVYTEPDTSMGPYDALPDPKIGRTEVASTLAPLLKANRVALGRLDKAVFDELGSQCSKDIHDYYELCFQNMEAFSKRGTPLIMVDLLE